MDGLLGEYLATLPSTYLQAGEVVMTDTPRLVTTVLGSCVAVCLFDRKSGRCGVCHAALPHAPVELRCEPFRYADEAVTFLLSRFERLGTPMSQLVVKVFGGADVLGTEPYEGYRSIGRQNTMAALEVLGWNGLRPSVRETGGSSGRKLVVVAHTGEVFVRALDRIVTPGAITAAAAVDE